MMAIGSLASLMELELAAGKYILCVYVASKTRKVDRDAQLQVKNKVNSRFSCSRLLHIALL
jgi:hypothetical protein